MLNGLPSILSASAPLVGNYYSIATTTVGAGGVASITFSSIPSTYTHLQLRVIVRGSANASIYVDSNSDTTNYARHRLTGDGSATASSGVASPTRALFAGLNGISNTANIFTTVVWDVLDYTNTNKNKTSRYMLGTDYNGSGQIEFGSSVWLSTSAVTSLTLTPSTGTLAQYSSFALYGVL
jgi:hypothetical protein